MLKDKLREFVDKLQPEDRKTLRAMVNGKLSKRTISPEAQEKMQDARRKKKRKKVTKVNHGKMY